MSGDITKSTEKGEKRSRGPHIGLTALVITEILRWVSIVIPVHLSVWQYTKYRGFNVFIEDVDVEVQFWCTVTGIIVLLSLGVYLPLKLLFIRLRLRRNWIRDQRWRPSIIVYIFICALPCLALVLVAVKFPIIEEVTQAGVTTSPDICFDGHVLHPETATVLQVVVFGLTITEWMSKLREEVMTYDLISAMAIDFFFAYDVIAFVMMLAYEPEVYNSDWVYVCFAFAWVAMFKYVPTLPVSLEEKGAPRGAVTAIIVSLVCNDIPFIIIRLITLLSFGYLVCDFINPVKNVGMIAFQTIQLFIIWRNSQDKKENRDVRFSEKRIAKMPGAWARMALVVPIVNGAIGARRGVTKGDSDPQTSKGAGNGETGEVVANN